jgi:hypothetical protein
MSIEIKTTETIKCKHYSKKGGEWTRRGDR